MIKYSLKKTLGCSMLLTFVSGQLIADETVWLSGNLTGNQKGIYGAKGVPSVEYYPGTRTSMGFVHDPITNSVYSIMGGGFGTLDQNSGRLADSWQYNYETSEWTYLGGSAGAANGVFGPLRAYGPTYVPGCHISGRAEIDVKRRIIILLGANGRGVSQSGFTSDVWYYNLTINQWAWMAGPNNPAPAAIYGTLGQFSSTTRPGGRQSYATTYDDSNGLVYMYGGFGVSNNATVNGFLNDIFCFNVDTYQWAFLFGSEVLNEPAVYAQIGIESASATPGGRQYNAISLDPQNNVIWMFGGSVPDQCDDLWSFNATSRLWTYWGGYFKSTSHGVYETKGTVSPKNWPSSRFGMSLFVDAKTRALYLIGGTGCIQGICAARLNDFWFFDLEQKLWAWIGGKNESNVLGVYGTKGVPSAGNWPGGRYAGGISYHQPSGTFYMFAGMGYDSQGFSQFNNDMWRFRVRTECRPGFRYDSTTRSCQLCASGTFKSEYGDQECLVCPGNSTCTLTAFSCNPGFDVQNDGITCKLSQVTTIISATSRVSASFSISPTSLFANTPTNPTSKPDTIWFLKFMQDNMIIGSSLIFFLIVLIFLIGFAFGITSVNQKEYSALTVERGMANSLMRTRGLSTDQSSSRSQRTNVRSSKFGGGFDHSLTFGTSNLDRTEERRRSSSTSSSHNNPERRRTSSASSHKSDRHHSSRESRNNSPSDSRADSRRQTVEKSRHSRRTSRR